MHASEREEELPRSRGAMIRHLNGCLSPLDSSSPNPSNYLSDLSVPIGPCLYLPVRTRDVQ